MRQIGILAAAGLIALEETPKILHRDHENARHLAEGLAKIKGVSLDPKKSATNIVIFDVRATGRTADGNLRRPRQTPHPAIRCVVVVVVCVLGVCVCVCGRPWFCSSLAWLSRLAVAEHLEQQADHQLNSTPLIQRDHRVQKAAGQRYSEIGTSGLRQFGGYVLEEWLTQIQGRRAAWVWREMMDNSPIVGAILFAIDWLSKTVEYRVEGKDERSKFVEECMHDMSQSWPDMISECLSCLPYGWCFSELVYKQRNGYTESTNRVPPDSRTGNGPIPDGARTVGLQQDTTENDSSPASSQFTDGKVGLAEDRPEGAGDVAALAF